MPLARQPWDHHEGIKVHPKATCILNLEYSPCRDSGENSTDDLSSSTLAYDSDGDTLVNTKPDSRTTRPGTIYYGNIDLFLLRNPDNAERDILMAEVDFRNLKCRPEGADGYFVNLLSLLFSDRWLERFPNSIFIGLNSSCTKTIS